MRIVCLVAVTVLLAGLATLPALRTAGAAPSASTIAPAALIDFGAIFGGDENEPDENETDAGEQQQQQPASEPPAPRSNISLALVLLIAVLGVLAAAFVVNRLRRLWARLRDLSAQASARVREWSGGS
jgi:hypothetical protein